MDRVFESGAAASPPSAPASPSNGYATSGNPGGTPATTPGAWWYHMITEELRAVVAAAGLTPDHTDLSQLSSAISALIGAAGANSKQTIWIPAGAMVARLTAGPAIGTVETATNKVMLKTLDFDAATAEYAQASIRMPKGWNEGTVTAYFLWSSTATGNAVWGIQAVAISDDDVLDVAFGGAQTVTDSVTAAGDLMQTAETAAVTVAGTPANGDLVVFQVYRDAANGSDTLAVDARLHGVVIVYTAASLSDA